LHVYKHSSYLETTLSTLKMSVDASVSSQGKDVEAMGKLLESKIGLEREIYEAQINDLKAQVDGLEAKVYNVEAASRLQAAR